MMFKLLIPYGMAAKIKEAGLWEDNTMIEAVEIKLTASTLKFQQKLKEAKYPQPPPFEHFYKRKRR